ncbi:unnamed protein product [Symbiodinium sp. CCMP2592]|nr:unnamed protein product [Symbiodinium sp. CCMP2592]CAE7367874.1 unnamed protein product [Symbiodinium sp. CCMP2592]
MAFLMGQQRHFAEQVMAASSNDHKGLDSVRVLNISFGWDETKQAHIKNKNMNGHEESVRHPKTAGSREYVHALVSSGTVCWSDGEGLSHAEEINLPPRQVPGTSSKDVGPALMQNLEEFIFGTSVSAFIESASKKYRSVSFYIVADSAKANLKTIRQLLAYFHQVAEESALRFTFQFTPCLMHQLMRVVLLSMDHKKLTSSMYSISRIQLSSTLKARTLTAMKDLLEKNFRYVPDETPPEGNPFFRRRLGELLKGALNVDMGELAIGEERCKLIDKALGFFNGNLLDKHSLCHFCTGCHRDRQHALSEVSCQRNVATCNTCTVS